MYTTKQLPSPAMETLKQFSDKNVSMETHRQQYNTPIYSINFELGHTTLETSARTENRRMTNHNTPQLSRMDLPMHCAAFPGLSLLNTSTVLIGASTILFPLGSHKCKFSPGFKVNTKNSLMFTNTNMLFRKFINRINNSPLLELLTDGIKW
jgi:hypothetical protein